MYCINNKEKQNSSFSTSYRYANRRTMQYSIPNRRYLHFPCRIVWSCSTGINQSNYGHYPAFVQPLAQSQTTVAYIIPLISRTNCLPFHFFFLQFFQQGFVFFFLLPTVTKTERYIKIKHNSSYPKLSFKPLLGPPVLETTPFRTIFISHRCYQTSPSGPYTAGGGGGRGATKKTKISYF